MKNYIRALGFVRPYWTRLGVASLAAALFSVFSAALIWLIGPLLFTLFRVGASTTPTPDPGELTRDLSWLATMKESIKGTVEGALTDPDPTLTLVNFCVAIAVIAFLKNGFNYLQSFLMAYAQQSVMRDIRNQLFRKYQSLSFDHYHHERTGAMMSRVTNDVSVLNESLDTVFNHLVADIALVALLTGFLVLLSWKLTLVAALMLPLVFVFIYFIGKKIRAYSGRTQERMADVAATLEENISNMRLVKAFGAERREIGKFETVTQRFFRSVLRMTRVARLSSPINDFLASVTGAGILLFAGSQVMSGSGEMDAADFVVFIIAMFSLIKPAKSLATAHARMSEGVAAADRIFGVLDVTPRIVERPDAQTLAQFRERIEYRNVSFAYRAGENVLCDVSLTVRKGEIVALVGPSGGGKSTLADLLPRFYDPQSGGLFIDNVDVRGLTLDSLRRKLGVVTQETHLFNDTVRANLAYGVDTATDDRIVGAAKAAHAHEFITEFPDGYDTRVGSRGMRLSGGQRQRLAIARALLRDPEILIFDEATSALDTESEALVQDAINTLLEGRTVIVIAHRLSTVRHADKIIVLDRGRIVEQGTHDILLTRDGLYAKLYRMQFTDASPQSIAALPQE